MTLRRAWAPALLAAVACTALPRPRASSYHPSDADLSVTRIVHRSVIVELHGTRLLVDPWFHSGTFTAQREPLGLVPLGLPPAAAVLLTGEGPDRFDPAALRTIAASVPRAIAPPALHDELAAAGFRQVDALRWWETTGADRVNVHAVPATRDGRENGYVLEDGVTSAYVGGGWRGTAGLEDVARAFPRIDVALLPIGGRRVLGVEREMGPDAAAQAVAVLEPRVVIPVGYGAAGAPPLWWYAPSPLEAFTDACSARGVRPDRIVVLGPGESWHDFRAPAR